MVDLILPRIRTVILIEILHCSPVNLELRRCIPIAPTKLPDLALSQIAPGSGRKIKTSTARSFYSNTSMCSDLQACLTVYFFRLWNTAGSLL
ncbi:uncharacterized protein ARMOST_19994 [Armillaria ostoyae]|uniref:Uncharacterized protein n=1 Tax=Armillaria ostoyae TaxID=47428 RepID=A0A284S630_ARMOS|nr:uncharacterized protein ARMOST_19994 [Armillaria ostoyae]